MNINDLTIGEAKELASMFASMFASVGNNAINKEDPFFGKYVICRCYSAGVHAGEFVSQGGDVVLLKNSRRLWSWKAKDGVALSGVAANGLEKGCKIDSAVSLVRLTGVIETLMCTDIAKESINGK